MHKPIWAFYFLTGGEKDSGSKKHTQGMGHAYRCMALIERICSRSLAQCLVITNKNNHVKNRLENSNIKIISPEKFFSQEKTDTIQLTFIDVNYLEKEFIHSLPGKVICLAPRGEGKLYADLSIRDTIENDVDGSFKNPPLSGPQYAVIHSDFLIERKKILQGKPKEKNSIVVSMGGIDHFNMTGTVAKGLIGLSSKFSIKFMISSDYPHEKSLQNILDNTTAKSKVLKGEKKLSSHLANAELGIFGCGLVCYEGLSVGTPSINLGHSEFHALRGKELEQFGVSKYMGYYDNLAEGGLVNQVKSYLLNRNLLKETSARCMDLVNGEGIDLILNRTIELCL